ncbi:unnamed protein product [Brassica rapa]|uniref:Uncharacterized protein n=1 Tax=Brassica campestris TaxID=3711 RepID=A0A3P6C8U3_BRACM|nr:unnamed protein product [Brassica rapa]VDD06031.1 unnamed protein product [Brassica rapa]
MSSVSLAVDPITDMDKTSLTSENGRWSGMTDSWWWWRRVDGITEYVLNF